ncbi:MAG: YkgJ family cysteine cluster protein [Candidatus Micrarchaeia archaeon]|jgi:Fe-S-cluster containining protein
MVKQNPKIINSCRACNAKCCRGLAVVLTIPEALRLVDNAAMRPEEILEFSRNIDSRRTPHYPLLVKHEKGVDEWFIIIRRLGRNCIFLHDDYSCAIYHSRPFVCRLYPFELDGRTIKKGALCPISFVREENMEPDAVKLKRDLLEHEVIARKWCVERGKRGEKPDMARFKDYFSRE